MNAYILEHCMQGFFVQEMREQNSIGLNPLNAIPRKMCRSTLIDENVSKSNCDSMHCWQSYRGAALWVLNVDKINVFTPK